MVAKRWLFFQVTRRGLQEPHQHTFSIALKLWRLTARGLLYNVFLHICVQLTCGDLIILVSVSISPTIDVKTKRYIS